MAAPDLLSKTKDECMECPVCYQECVHPVRLPCSHIFCYLCVKGVVTRTKKCAMCRLAIPLQYLENPDMIGKSDLDVSQQSDTAADIQWFYQARRRGWWLYEKRIASELELKYHEDPHAIFDLQIAGFLYTINFENMEQYRKDDRSVSRAIKRDLIKHVDGLQGQAGIRLNNSSNNSLGSRTVEGSTTSDNDNLVSNAPANALPTDQSTDLANDHQPRPVPNARRRSRPSSPVDITRLVADMNLVDKASNSDGSDDEPESLV